MSQREGAGILVGQTIVSKENKTRGNNILQKKEEM
jgi:hypothetical protein